MRAYGLPCVSAATYLFTHLNLMWWGFSPPPTSLLSLSSQNFACCLHNFILYIRTSCLIAGLSSLNKPAIKQLVRKTCSHFCCCCCGPLPAEAFFFFFKGRGEEKGDLTTKCEMRFKPMQLWLHEPAANRLKAPWQSSELWAHSFLFSPNPIWLWTFYLFFFLRPSTNGSPPNPHLGSSCLLIQAPSLRVANVTVQLWNMAVPLACVAVSHAGTWPIVALQCWQLQIKRKKRKGNIFPLLPAEKKKNLLFVLHALSFFMQFMQELVLNIHIFIL